MVLCNVKVSCFDNQRICYERNRIYIIDAQMHYCKETNIWFFNTDCLENTIDFEEKALKNEVDFCETLYKGFFEGTLKISIDFGYSLLFSNSLNSFVRYDTVSSTLKPDIVGNITKEITL